MLLPKVFPRYMLGHTDVPYSTVIGGSCSVLSFVVAFMRGAAMQQLQQQECVQTNHSGCVALVGCL